MIEIRHGRTGRSPVVVVEQAHGSTRDLARLLRAATRADDVGVVVDLGQREDASSDLLTVLHRAAQDVRRTGRTIAVVAGHPSLRRLFDLTLVSVSVPVFATRDEALRAWS